MSEDIAIEGEKIGVISHFFGQIGVAAIELSGKLKVGDKVKFKGVTTDFDQEINSMQIENQSVNEANMGDSIGVKIGEKVRVGDFVFKIK